MRDNLKKTEHLKALERRTFRFKNPVLEFFCPLCRSKRALSTHHRLSGINYLQILALTFFASTFLWPLMDWRSLFSVLPIWVTFEAIRRMIWRKDVPCPHCGFDASWYKRDVKVARKKVSEFWEELEVKNEDQEEDIPSSNVPPLSSDDLKESNPYGLS